MMPHCHGLLHQLTHDFGRVFKVESFARVPIHLQGKGIQRFLAV